MFFFSENHHTITQDLSGLNQSLSEATIEVELLGPPDKVVHSVGSL